MTESNEHLADAVGAGERSPTVFGSTRDPADPAAYINSNFGADGIDWSKVDVNAPEGNKLWTMRAIREADEAAATLRRGPGPGSLKLAGWEDEPK